jgi:hypothetical protein
MYRAEIYNAIDAERDYQDNQWGGFEHDQKHTIDNWVAFMLPYLGWAVKGDNWEEDPEKIKEGLIKVAALCVAALENLDNMPQRL